MFMCVTYLLGSGTELHPQTARLISPEWLLLCLPPLCTTPQNHSMSFPTAHWPLLVLKRHTKYQDPIQLAVQSKA
jgi:hypothetical protein